MTPVHLAITTNAHSNCGPMGPKELSQKNSAFSLPPTMNRSIKRDFQYLSIFTIIVSMVLLSGFWVYYDYQSFHLESERVRTKYMAEYRDLLQYQVNRVVEEIKYQQSVAESHLKESLQEHVHIGVRLAEDIFSRYQGRVDETFLEQLMRDSLLTLTFNKGSGKLFIISDNSSTDPDSLNPGGGATPDRAEVLVQIKGENETLFGSTGVKEGTGEEVPILSYATRFPQLGWIIGMREYLDDFSQKVQQDTILHIEQIRFGKNGQEYIFATTYDGVSLTYPAKNKNMLGVQDSNGVYIVQELIKQAKAGGGFVQYVMPKIAGLPPKPKLSYAAPIPGWNWYIGAGVYIDEIDTIIQENRQTLWQGIKRHLLLMTAVLGGLLALHFTIAFYISRKVLRQIEIFSSFFRKATTHSVSMETSRLDYREFKEISRLANDMLKERNSILREIRLSRDEWVNTFNAIGDCIITLDDRGVVEKANESAGDFFSIPPSEFVGKPFEQICSMDTPARLTLQDHSPHTMEIDVRDRDMTILASSFPLFAENGDLQRIILIAHDITEKKRLEGQLLQSQKMEAIGTLAGGIAHDFNNILSAILGYTQLTLTDIKQELPVDHYLEQVLQAGYRARDLVKQILTFSRQVKTEKAAVYPGTITKEALKLLRSSLPSTITIKQDIDAECGTVFIDPTQLHQIIMNLCTNAYHAMEDGGGTISVKLSQHHLAPKALSNSPDLAPGEYIELLIEDEGCGIAPDLQKKIFDPFFTTKTRGKGTGMGLAIVHGIIKECKGYISLESQVGKGTSFSINLPVYSESSPVREEAVKPISVGQLHILVVDDEKMLADMLATLLKRTGFTVSAFSSGPEALASFKDNPEIFDLVITDQTMPEITGLELAEKILEHRADIPIILCSGHSSAISEDDIHRIGIKGFAPKPLIREEILQIISSVFSKRQ